MSKFSFEPIGEIRSCFKEKFGVPRQPRLVPSARAVLKLRPGRNLKEALRGLGGFSHAWIVFVFHASLKEGWNPLVRPPRLGGARKVGVLASRSPHRPCAIGLSAVEITRVAPEAKGGAEVHFRGVDILDGTPVLDLKPYVPYADSIPDARAGWGCEVASPSPRMDVTLSDQAARACRTAEASGYANLEDLITQVLTLDPRPAFQKRRASASASYATRLEEFDVHWEVHEDRCNVTEIRDLSVLKKRDI